MKKIKVFLFVLPPALFEKIAVGAEGVHAGGGAT